MILENKVDSAVLYDLLNAASKGFMVFNVADELNGTERYLNCIFANKAAAALTGVEVLCGSNYQSVFNCSCSAEATLMQVPVKYQFPNSGNYCLIERSAASEGHLLYTLTKIPQPEKVEILPDYRQKLWQDAEEVMQFGGWVWDLEDGSMQWTEGMYQLMGYEKTELDREELTIDHYKEHIHPDDLEQFSLQINKVRSFTDSYIIEFRIIAHDGVEKFLYLRGENTKDKISGHIVSVGTVFNVSMLRLMQSELEQKVSDLNKSNSDLEQFAYIASHDLQEPLRKIVSFGERLNNKAREALNEEQHLYLDRILNATRRMQEMINNLLEFSRVSSASKVYIATDLNEIMRSTLSDLEVTLQQNGAQIELGLLPVIEVIPAQISQLFLNLLSNSLKFIRPGVVPVITITHSDLTLAEIFTRKLPADEDYVKILFRDNGIGFENSSADKIFTIFQRLRGRSEYEGAGIGLAVCKKVVERHHGLIDAFGVVNGGATFEIILPKCQN